jgi:hypothetical protein
LHKFFISRAASRPEEAGKADQRSGENHYRQVDAEDALRCVRSYNQAPQTQTDEQSERGLNEIVMEQGGARAGDIPFSQDNSGYYCRESSEGG